MQYQRDDWKWKNLVQSGLLITAWKVSIFAVLVLRISPHSDWISNRKTPNTDTFLAVYVDVSLAADLHLNIWKILKVKHVNCNQSHKKWKDNLEIREEWWRVMQSLKKTDQQFQIWHKDFGEFSPNHSKV